MTQKSSTNIRIYLYITATAHVAHGSHGLVAWKLSWNISYYPNKYLSILSSFCVIGRAHDQTVKYRPVKILNRSDGTESVCKVDKIQIILNISKIVIKYIYRQYNL